MPADVNDDPPAPRRRRPVLLRRLLFALLLALLCASIASSVLLYRQANENYVQLSQAQLDPYGLKHPGFVVRGRPEHVTRVVFFGDSRARDWPAPQVAGCTVINRGIGGQTTEQVRGRIDAHVIPLKPCVVVVQAGINDLKAIPLFPQRRDEIVADCKANLREIVRRCTNDGLPVIITTIFPPGHVPLQRRMVWSPEIEKAVEEVNADLRALAGEHVVVLDAWKLLEDHGQLRSGLGLDTLHLNARGYQALNVALEKILRTLPKPPAGGA